jgi:hypothetical protein
MSKRLFGKNAFETGRCRTSKVREFPFLKGDWLKPTRCARYRCATEEYATFSAKTGGISAKAIASPQKLSTAATASR